MLGLNKEKNGVYKTKNLYVCDIRMITFRRGDIFQYNDQPFFAICKKMPGNLYMDLLSGMEYQDKNDALKYGARNERFVLSAKNFSMAMQAVYPTMTIEDIQEESYRLNNTCRQMHYDAEL